jgi:hypothetical protein
MASKLTLFLSLSWLLFANLGWAQSKAPQYWIIANDISLNAIGRNDIEPILLGEQSMWRNGRQIIVVHYTNKSTEAQLTADLFFDGKVISMQKYWLSMVFQGRVKPPIFLGSHKEIVDYVSTHQGAIAIVYSSDFPEQLAIEIQ